MLKYNLKMTAEVDLPKMPVDLINRILEWHDAGKKLLDNAGAKGIDYPWISTHIRDNAGIDDPVSIPFLKPGSPWNREFVKLFPEAISYFECLPLVDIERIVLLEAKKKVWSHVDRSKTHCPDNRLEPASYRMYLRESKSDGFYVQSRPMKEWGNHRAIEPISPGYEYLKEPLPYRFWRTEIGQWWVLDNFCSQHGSKWQAGDNKVILSVQGKIHEGKHRELLDRSKNMRCIKHDDLVAAESAGGEAYEFFVKQVNQANESYVIPEHFVK